MNVLNHQMEITFIIILTFQYQRGATPLDIAPRPLCCSKPWCRLSSRFLFQGLGFYWNIDTLERSSKTCFPNLVFFRFHLLGCWWPIDQTRKPIGSGKKLNQLWHAALFYCINRLAGFCPSTGWMAFNMVYRFGRFFGQWLGWKLECWLPNPETPEMLFHHRWPNCKCQAAGSTHFLVRSWHLYLMLSRVSVLGPNVQQLTCLQFSPGGNGGKTNDPRMLSSSILGWTGAPSSTNSKVIFGNFTSQTPPVIPKGSRMMFFTGATKFLLAKIDFGWFFGQFSSKGWAAKIPSGPLASLQNINLFSPKVLHKSSCTQRSHTWPSQSLEKTITP